MEIIYSSKARKDLERINWKIRNAIIEHLSQAKGNTTKKLSNLKPISNTSFYKIDFNSYVAITKIEDKSINILTVVEKKELKVPE